MPTEIIESKEIYRGFIALRLATLRLRPTVPCRAPQSKAARSMVKPNWTGFDPKADEQRDFT